MSKKVETKHAVICAKAETARMEHLIDGHWKPAVERLEEENAELRVEVERLRADLGEQPGYDDRKALLDIWYGNGGTVPVDADLRVVYSALIEVAQYGWKLAAGYATEETPE